MDMLSQESRALLVKGGPSPSSARRRQEDPRYRERVLKRVARPARSSSTREAYPGRLNFIRGN